MAPPLIQLKDITLTFGGTPLLKRINSAYRRASASHWSAVDAPQQADASGRATLAGAGDRVKARGKNSPSAS
jgi:hypothetical protein